MSNVSLIDGHIDRVQKTNFEYMKEMGVEGLAEEFGKNNCCHFCKLNEGQTCNNTPCKQGIMQYLKSEVDTE